jgi:carbamate kinase
LSKQQYQASSSIDTRSQKSAETKKVDFGEILQSEMTHEFKAPKRDRLSGLSRREKRRKMTMEEEKESGDKPAIDAAIRLAKRTNRPSKIGIPEKHASKRSGQKNKRRTSGRKKGGFDSEMGSRKAGRRVV